MYIAFDQDDNQAGQKAAHQLARRLQSAGIHVHIVRLPEGLDPNSYFVAGARAADFTARLRGSGPTGYEVLCSLSAVGPRQLLLALARAR